MPSRLLAAQVPARTAVHMQTHHASSVSSIVFWIIFISFAFWSLKAFADPLRYLPCFVDGSAVQRRRTVQECSRQILVRAWISRIAPQICGHGIGSHLDFMTWDSKHLNLLLDRMSTFSGHHSFPFPVAAYSVTSTIVYMPPTSSPPSSPAPPQHWQQLLQHKPMQHKE